MNVTLQADRFAIGQPVSRKEDPTLLRGAGSYTDDVVLPGQAYAVMVRSPYAHGVLRGLDIEAARAMPGVLGIYQAADLRAAGIGDMPAAAARNADGTAAARPSQSPLAQGKVRYVGDPIAVVVAESPMQARDAAEAAMPDIEPLPAVTDGVAALAPGAPLVWDEVAGNLVLSFAHGDAASVARAFAGAAHVTKLALTNNRIVVNPMEPRAAIGEYDAASGRWTLRLGSQGVFGMRDLVRSVLGAERDQVRILTGQVGGSFGMKASCYPEYIAVLHAARALGRPVKWRDHRTESFLSDSHGRDHQVNAELALDADGTFLALRLDCVGNLGAYLSNTVFLPAAGNTAKNVVGVYRTPLLQVTSRLAFTNTTPVGAYRGAGRPEGNYYMERLVEAAAGEMGIPALELRRRNHIAPDAMPYAAPSGMEYDSGDFPALLDHALAEADWDGFPARRAESARRGRRRGRGVGQYLEVTAPPSNEMGGIRFEPDGTVTIVTGTLDYGQGHATPFAQILSQHLGVPYDRIRLLQGDSDQLIAGGGTGGSKSLMASGGAIVEASAKVVEAGRRIAAHALEAAEADIEFGAGRFSVAGTDRGIGIMELAERLRGGLVLPPDLPQSLDVSHLHEGAPSAFPNGCHVAEVEIDAETGVCEVVKYTMVNDFGVVVNPTLVAGQAHGGVMQGIGQALRERTVYDPEGQLLTGSFMDYAMPRATEAPDFVWDSHPVPAKTNLLGAKGCGEAGCAGSLPAVMNAVVDALGGRHIDMPATPERIWEALREA